MDNKLASRIVTPEKLVQNQGAKVLVYGMAGAGKTSLAKTAPKKLEAATKTIIKAVISKVFTSASWSFFNVNFL